MDGYTSAECCLCWLLDQSHLSMLLCSSWKFVLSLRIPWQWGTLYSPPGPVQVLVKFMWYLAGGVSMMVPPLGGSSGVQLWLLTLLLYNPSFCSVCCVKPLLMAITQLSSIYSWRLWQQILCLGITHYLPNRLLTLWSPGIEKDVWCQ